MNVQLADFNILPFIIMAVVFSVLGNKKKRQQPPPSGGGSGGLMGDLGRALEELKRAEAEARRAQQQPPEPQKPPVSQSTRAVPPMRAKAQSKVMKREIFMPKPRPQVAPAGRMAKVKLALEDHGEMSSEDMPGAARDYDDEAENIIAARRKFAERGAREEASAEELSALQIARRGDRTPVMIGGRAEHAAFDARRDAPVPTPERAKRSGLGRFADGSLRGALVLGEILGRPLGDR